MKEILKPTWKKVIISFVVLAVLAIISYFPILPLRAVYYNMPLAGIIILLIISLISGFYIGETNKWFKGILLALALLIILTIASVYFVGIVYNPLFGYSCNEDSDCLIVDCTTPANKQYIEFRFLMFSCPLRLGPSWTICENNECKTILDYDSVESVDFCDRLNGSPKEACYQHFALKLNDTSLCDKLSKSSFCYERLAIQLKDKTLCDKILDNTERARCIIGVSKI